jgi:hypothetical protein
MNAFLNRTIVPKLVQHLRDDSNSILDDTLECILLWNNVIPRMNLLAIIYGEFFPKWVRYFSKLLCGGDLTNAIRAYVSFRSKFPDNILRDIFALGLHRLLLALEDIVNSEKYDSLNKIVGLYEMSCYDQCLRKLSTYDQEELRSKNKSLEMNISSSVSLKATIEKFAEKNGYCFLPKTGHFIDGKQIWKFGNRLLYIEKDVLFVKNTVDTSWLPITLEDLKVSAL